MARPGSDRRLDRDRAAVGVVARRARTWRGESLTADGPRPSYSATVSTCRTRPAQASSMQERLMCFNADTGKLLWEHRYNIFTSDVPPHRIAWASPAVDPATGNVFAFSGNGLLMSLSTDGKLLWERSLAEEFGMWTTHGGRMSSPIIDGDQMIVSGLTFLWGQHAGGAHRFISFDKTNGQTIWMSAPEGRPTDTIYANPFIADVNGVTDVLLGRQRRRHARAQECDRRAGLELDGQPAWPEHRRAR